MAYVKQTWQTGDVVTSAKLNHIEDGVAAGGAFVVVPTTFDNDTYTITSTKTWSELYALAAAGNAFVFLFNATDTSLGTTDVYFFPMFQILTFDNVYEVICIGNGPDGTSIFVADSSSGYPAFAMD